MTSVPLASGRPFPAPGGFDKVCLAPISSEGLNRRRHPMAFATRRDVLNHGLLAVLGRAAWPLTAREPEPKADRGPELALFNGTVYTVDDRRPRAEAFAVQNGRFVAVGSTADIRKRITASTKVIDADK